MEPEVKEPPTNVSTGGVEPHARRTGHRMFDLIVAGSAILISCVSLFVAMGHGETMQRQVAAASWPLLEYTNSNVSPDAKAVLYLSIGNAGVGPAVVREFSVRYKGQSFNHGERLLAACCGHRLPTRESPPVDTSSVPLTRPVANTVIRAGEERQFLVLPMTDANRAIWERLNQARYELSFDACYCSVLGECWRSDLKGVEPKKVDACAPSSDKTQY